MSKRFYFVIFLLTLCLLPFSCFAESLTLDLGDATSSFSGRLIQVFIVFTILSVAPSLIIMVTSFTRIVVVLSFLRNSLGLQQSPPNMVILSLAMFLTFFVMGPVFEDAYKNGIEPLVAEKITEEEAFDKTTEPFKDFMLRNVREKDLGLFMDLVQRGEVAKGNKSTILEPKDTPLKVLIPAFMISELKRAFEIGFLIFIPFLIIDLVVAAVLMSMGMMMLPPVMISLPFKIVFFILIDGWHLLCGSLINSFSPG